MTALSMALSLAESYIPIPIPAPGIKLGFANIVTLILLIKFNLPSALMVSAARSVLAAVFSGAASAMLFSLAGGISSCVTMWLFLKLINLDFSLIGVSIIGAATHNTAQILTAMLLMNDGAILYYLPILLLCGIASGTVIGFLAIRAMEAFRHKAI
jgi:heptaprenyl diphosphate synthase